MDLFYIIALLFNQNQIKMSEHKRFIISIPYYAEDVSEVREAVKKLAKAVEFPYASIHSQFTSDNHKTIFLEEVETEIKNYELFLDFGEFIGTQTIYSSNRIADCVKRQANMLKDLDKYYTTEWQGLPKDVVAINIDETTITLDNRYIKTLNEEQNETK